MRVFLILLYSLGILGPTGFAAEPVSAPKPAKIALVTKENSNAVKSLLDLAQVELSKDNRFALVERQAIDRILTEQKLNLSGLVDANDAVKAGKLLAVDVIARQFCSRKLRSAHRSDTRRWDRRATSSGRSGKNKRIDPDKRTASTSGT